MNGTRKLQTQYSNIPFGTRFCIGKTFTSSLALCLLECFVNKQPCCIEKLYLSFKNHVKYFHQDWQEQLSTSERGDFDYSLKNLSGKNKDKEITK